MPLQAAQHVTETFGPWYGWEHILGAISTVLWAVVKFWPQLDGSQLVHLTEGSDAGPSGLGVSCAN